MRFHLNEGEQILGEVRKHWFVMLGHIIFSIILALAPYLLLGLVVKVLPQMTPAEVNWHETFPFTADWSLTDSKLGQFFYLVWLLLIWLMFMMRWTVYYLDVWLITGSRIVAIDQKSMFHREATSLYLERVQDVTIEIQGLLQTIFNFGTIHVQTAGAQQEIILRNAKDPEATKSLILDLYRQFDHRHQ